MDIEEVKRILDTMSKYELYALEAVLHGKMIRSGGILPPDKIPKISKGECKRVIKYIRANQKVLAWCDTEATIKLIRNVWMVKNDD